LCIESIYSFITYIYIYIYDIYYSSGNTTVLFRQRLKRHVSTYKVIVRLAKNYETLTKWLCAQIKDTLIHQPSTQSIVPGSASYTHTLCLLNYNIDIGTVGNDYGPP
jgi:hypothetical protein